MFSQLLHQAFLEPGQPLLRVRRRREGLAVGREQVLPEGQAQNVQVFPTVPEGAGQRDEDWREEKQQVGRRRRSGRLEPASGVSPFRSFRYSGSIRTTPSETQSVAFSLDPRRPAQSNQRRTHRRTPPDPPGPQSLSSPGRRSAGGGATEEPIRIKPQARRLRLQVDTHLSVGTGFFKDSERENGTST